MKKRNNGIIRLLLFCVFCLTLLLVFYLPVKGVVTSYYKNHPGNKLKYILDEKNDAEIMIWGASTAKHHFDTYTIQKALSKSCFNMGEDGLAFIQYNGLLKEYLNYANPKHTLVIVLSLWDISNRDKIALQNYFLPYLDNDNISNSLQQIDKNWVLKNKRVPFYKLINWDIEIYKTAFEERWKPSSRMPDTLLGYVPLNKPEHFIYNKDIEPITKCKVDKLVVENLIATLNNRPKGMKCIILTSPVYNKALTGAQGLQTYKDEIIAISTKTGSVFFDYLGNEAFSDSTLFCYNAHLNVKGAQKLTELFINDMRVEDKK